MIERLLCTFKRCTNFESVKNGISIYNSPKSQIIWITRLLVVSQPVFCGYCIYTNRSLRSMRNEDIDQNKLNIIAKLHHSASSGRLNFVDVFLFISAILTASVGSIFCNRNIQKLTLSIDHKYVTITTFGVLRRSKSVVPIEDISMTTSRLKEHEYARLQIHNHYIKYIMYAHKYYDNVDLFDNVIALNRLAGRKLQH
ncbi:hypothetical protein GJ496_011720 [Pomphorhynchus laevis]|nr:hypothetical protein GJ496_011720 [Pomphorhynchus laevis]